MRVQQFKPRARRAPKASEHDIQTAIMRRLQMAGWLVVRVNSNVMKTDKGFYRAYAIQGMSGHGGAGFPDVLALHGPTGRYCLIECKTDRGQLTESQQRFHEFARRHGVEVHVLRHPDEVAEVVGP